MPFIRQLIASGVLGGATLPTFLVATTTAPGQTVTIDRLRPTGGSITINWGDGGTTTVNNGDTTSKAHVYASTGVYNITVANLALVTGIILSDAKLGSFNTSMLVGNVITYFNATAITGSIINTADMVGWMPTDWRLYSMPAGGTYTINSSHMASWTPTLWYFYSMPAGTYTINSSHMASWTPTSWQLYSTPAGTYTINSANMTGWSPTYWMLYSMAAGTYTINTANMASWTPAYWYLFLMPSGTYTFSDTDFDGWTTTTIFRLYSLDPAVVTAVVDDILYSFHKASTSRTGTNGTITLSGTNQAPSGVYQAAAACPVDAATPGKEIAHELVNDGCGAIANHWATVTITA